MQSRIASSYSLVALAIAMAGCAGSGPGDGTPGPADPTGTPVETHLPPGQQAELRAIQEQLDEVKDLDAPAFAKKYAVPFSTDLGYDPLAAKGLELVQASSLALVADEQAALG